MSGSRRDRASQVTRARRERRRTLSPREMARLYYAAFPSLGPESTPDKLPAARTWPSRRNTLHAPAPPKHKSRRAPRSQPRHPPPQHPQPAHLPEWVTHPDTWDYDSQDPIQDFVKSITMDEGYGTCDNTLADEIIGSKRLYERDSDSGDTDDVLLFNDWVIEDDLCFRPKSRNEEEESIAMFKAKFSTMENLWATDEPIVISNANVNVEVYQELPVDLQVLLSSPSDKIFECCESPDKAMPASLTASIWSNNDTNQECDSGDFTSRNEDYQPSTYGSDVGSNLYPNQSNLWQIGTESYNKESMEQIYNKLQPLNLDDSEETSGAIDVNTFDFKDDTVFVTPPAQTSNRSSMLDPYSLHCYADDVLESVPAATTAIRSLTALNHNPLYSSFTEVIPKFTAGYVGDGIQKKHNRFKLDVPPTKSSPKEDDDLLTSMRTHFRPIKRESATTTQAVVTYDNGVTFPIISDLDEVKFSRSSSGSLFLESDMEPPKQYMEYRTQGIDYARLDISPSADGSDDGGLACTDLILKFKVCQTDMSVQTEEFGAKIESSPKAVDADSTLSGCSSASSLACLNNSARSEDKFCPILDIDSELESLQLNWIQCEKCKIDSESWSSIPVNDQASWHPMYNSTKIWSLDDNFCKDCSKLQAEEKAKRKTSKKTLVYKEEAAREWEELLSDISYAHHLQTDSDEATTPSDIYDIAPKEITVRATDGNFIRSALMAQQQEGDGEEEEDRWVAEGKGFNIVGSILNQSLSLYSAKKGGWGAKGAGGGGDRKRRHSAGGAGGAGKLRCPLPAPPAPPHPPHPLQPLLAAVDRPLTR